MKKFIRVSVLFILPVFTLLILADLLLRNIPNDYSFKKKYLDVHSNEVEVLYLGSSHSYYGINPDYSNFKSFNASHISQSLDFDLAIFKKYNGNWKNLKYVVIPIDYFSLYSNLQDGIEKWRVKNYAIYYNLNEKSSYLNNFEILNGQFKGNFMRLKSHYINNTSNLTTNNLGWGFNYNSKNGIDLIESGKTAAKRHTIINEWHESFQNNVNTINAFIDLAEKNNIKIIFVTTPAFKTYVQNLNHNQLDTTIETITQITSKSLNSVYYNLLNDKSFIAEDFYDADHLNEKGAKKLTFKIDSLIINN